MPSIALKTTRHIIYVGIIAFCFLIQSGCSSDSETDTPSAVNYTESGWRAYKSGEYAQALLSFERALNFDEQLADAYNGVGWSHLSLSLNPTLAQEAFQNAVQLDAPNADAWVGLANVLYLRNKDATDFRSAIRSIDNALQGDTQYLFRHDYRSKADLYALKASCYYYLGEVQSARQETDKALQIDAANRTAVVLRSLIKP
jgi:tetratricopeptide (TPR) repeat protein